MKKLFIGFLLFTVSWVNAQTPAKPKLVVGIVVDQMRWDYLYRFYDRYGAGGFKRLLTQGFSCENTFIPYTPTHTAAGHSCIYTGSVPALNGIIGNSWYDRERMRTVYCTEDSTVTGVGSNSAEGKMSPRNLWASTITDELRVSTNFRNKTIGIALKDRGSILPAGHTATAAYWFDNASGGWISSSHYMQTLPAWMQQLNARKLPDAYMAQNWNTLYPVSTYTQSTEDSKPYENNYPGEDNTFPHRTDTIGKNRYEAFRTNPFANTFTVDAAKAAIDGENLGGRGETDFLALSFSSPDYVGHTFGPNSVEVEDTYLRLDKDLSELLLYLDTKIGKGQYLLFLSADHAVAHASGFLKEHKFPTGLAGSSALLRAANAALKQEFGEGKFILTFTNYQVYLNDDLIAEKKLNRDAIKRTILRTLLKQPGIFRVVDLENIATSGLPSAVLTPLTNGYNQRLSGDLQYLYMPFYGSYEKGASHGYWNPFDTHIPLVWFGWNIKKGKTSREVYMTDIAPTLAAMLKIQMPNASIGKVITEVVPLSP
jgi:predicted AlkP superfamily pyrophosphatase or phosphodiesterase